MKDMVNKRRVLEALFVCLVSVQQNYAMTMSPEQFKQGLVSFLQQKRSKAFGSWSISEKLFAYIRSVVPQGEAILEFGSGWGTGQLVKYYTVYSIEHDKRWLNKYHNNYIYAPIVNGWYDVEVLKKQLPVQYSLMLVDGPPQKIGRGKFFDNIALFNTQVPIIFDDVQRQEEFDLMAKVAQALGRSYVLIEDGNEVEAGKRKKFGVV